MAKKVEENKLNERQERFIVEYLKDLNGTQAAIRAGYSKNSAYNQANRMMRNDEVLERLKKEITKINKKERIELNDVLSELKSVAFSRITDYVKFNDNEVKLLDSKLIEDSKIKAIETIIVNESEKGTFKKIKLHSKIAALSRLLDYLEMQTDDKDNTLKINLIRRVIRE